MDTSSLLLIAAILFSSLAAAAQNQSPATSPPALSQDQIRDMIRQAADKDMENDKRARDYTYIEREEKRTLDGSGRVKSTDVETHEVMVLYGEPVERLIGKDDKPLSAKDAAKEDQRIQKLMDKRKNESAEDRRKRDEKEEKEREEGRAFVRQVADAYNFRLVGLEDIEGRPTYVIDADPRPGYEPHGRGAKFLPDFRFRVWVDRAENEWVKMDIQCIHTASVGLFLVRVQGSNIQIEQTHVNNEVWLPQHVALKLDARIALFKGLNEEDDVTFRDYRKFRTDTKILPAASGGAR
jgi:hypothetical protein